MSKHKGPERPGKKYGISLRLSKSEREAVSRRAADAGLSVNEYLRRVLGLPEPSTEANPYLACTPAASLNAGRI